ncbi:glycosyltransferase family 2 protein [bacterium]|nr:glycosyltransferase family 2 protein [candidate division CSSED10-310 bacterium]
MKLVIQIPCYNEADTLAATIADLPRSIPGIDSIEILIIDDGSTDSTIQTARQSGVHKIVSFQSNQGLAKAFGRGLIEAARMNADIVVNTDADQQYPGRCILALVKPILDNTADIVVGCRPIENISHFSPVKKRLQKMGSRVVMWLTGVEVSDVTSGFRAYSQRAIRRLKILSEFTYTIETLIQAAKSGMRVVAVPTDVNPPTRPSRLFRSNWYYIRRQIGTILRIWALYSPDKLFNWSGMSSLFLGALLLVRFLYYYILRFPDPSGKIQSLVVASVLLSLGFSLLLFGVVTDLIRINRKLLEETIDRLDTLARQDNDIEG